MKGWLIIRCRQEVHSAHRPVHAPTGGVALGRFLIGHRVFESRLQRRHPHDEHPPAGHRRSASSFKVSGDGGGNCCGMSSPPPDVHMD
jgi:hypothetical protein